MRVVCGVFRANGQGCLLAGQAERTWTGVASRLLYVYGTRPACRQHRGAPRKESHVWGEGWVASVGEAAARAGLLPCGVLSDVEGS